MAAILMPFVMSMLLGRSIDLTTYDVGGEVYDYSSYNETKVNEFVSTYTVLQDNSFPYSFAGLPVDLVMKVKAGLLHSSSGAMGLDGLLRETEWKQRSAVIAVTSAVQTVRRTLRNDAQPLQNWRSRVSDSQTHYASSIVYGGWAFVLYRFKCDLPGDAEIVRKTLTSTLGFHGDLGPDSIKLWEEATKAIRSNPEIRGKVTMYIKTYATFPLEQNLASPQGLLQAVDQIPKLVGPVGKPMIMELQPLHELDEKYPVVSENHKLDTQLETLVEMYDDVKNTKNSINRWASKSDSAFTEEQEDKIADLFLHLSVFIKLFHEVASEASIYKSPNQELVKSAVLGYKSQLKKFVYSYDRIFRRLKEDFYTGCANNFHGKINGLLKVDTNEQMEVKRVEGGLEECKAACLAEPKCRSVGYADRIVTSKLSDTLPQMWRLKTEKNLCFVYFRSSSTADVIQIPGNSIVGIYDRKCQ